MSQRDLEAENASLRARVADLERAANPLPASTAAGRADPVRYVLAAGSDAYADPQSPWVTIQETFVRSAFVYARQRHPDLGFHRAFAWDDIPEGGVYTTTGAVLGAKRGDVDVPFYEVDRRTAAINAVEVQQKRLHDREGHLVEEHPGPDDIDAFRVWYFRWHLLSDASGPAGIVDRAFLLACEPLADYTDVVLAATEATERVLRLERSVTLESIPGYLPGGCWTCDKCGYPFDDSTGFTCAACQEADPASRAAFGRIVDWFASNEKPSVRAAAGRLVDSRRERLEALRWMVPTDARQAECSSR